MDKERVVSRAQAEEYARSKGMLFLEARCDGALMMRSSMEYRVALPSSADKKKGNKKEKIIGVDKNVVYFAGRGESCCRSVTPHPDEKHSWTIGHPNALGKQIFVLVSCGVREASEII